MAIGWHSIFVILLNSYSDKRSGDQEFWGNFPKFSADTAEPNTNLYPFIAGLYR